MKNIDVKNIELLSPAGSFECVKSAISGGADAIYMGGEKFSARAFAKSAEENSIIDSIIYTKKNGKKFYLTVNTLFKQKELKEIFLYIDPLVSEGVDAFIVQDLGVAMLLKDRYKNVALHASTQMNITSSKAVNLVRELGFSQVVLARELSLREIKEIRKEVRDDIKLECFIHGSMCYCYSGCCLMSSFIGGESGNRGRCKGPCRLPYTTRTGAKQPVGASTASPHAPYIISMKDMCALDSLANLINAGVTSFKIEGRMRKPEYVYGTTKTYRKYIDNIISNLDSSIVGAKQNVEAKQNVGESTASPLSSDKLCDFNIKNDEKYLLDLYNKGGFTNYYNEHNNVDMIQKHERN